MRRGKHYQNRESLRALRAVQVAFSLFMTMGLVVVVDCPHARAWGAWSTAWSFLVLALTIHLSITWRYT